MIKIDLVSIYCSFIYANYLLPLCMTDPKYIHVPFVFLSDEARILLQSESFVCTEGMMFDMDKHSYAISGRLWIHKDYLNGWEEGRMPIDEDKEHHRRACYLSKEAYKLLCDSGFVCETESHLSNPEGNIYYLKKTFLSKEEHKKCNQFTRNNGQGPIDLVTLYEYMEKGYHYVINKGLITYDDGRQLMIIDPSHISSSKEFNLWKPEYCLSITI
jgi:hypothetical protein